MSLVWRGHRIERPEPVVSEMDVVPVTRRSCAADVMAALDGGAGVLIEDYYATGLDVLFHVRKAASVADAAASFATERAARGRYRELSNRVFIPVEGNRISLRKSPEIGWLERLYPDRSDFLLPLPSIQGLNSSWQWYRKGVLFPVLDDRIYPYYGVYCPSRFDHLVLFEQWLRGYRGARREAIEIGTGCGVLTCQLLNHGFDRVHAGDISVNAVVSMAEHAERYGLNERVTLHISDLFETIACRADLVLFNPPWLPATVEVRGLDRAIYYEPDLFERFFQSAGDHLSDTGVLVLLFSNRALKEGVSDLHPVREELKNNRRFRCADHRRKRVRRSSAKTRRRDRRDNEFVELWILEKR